MPKVRNWQINRTMEYPYEENRLKKQVAFIFDTNKCILCQTCSVACKTTWTSGRGQETMFWNNVETKPYGFYPLAWDIKILEKLGRQKWNRNNYEGKTIFESAPQGERVLGYLPEAEDYSSPNLGEDEISGIINRGAFFKNVHSVWMFYLARICNHCTYPACLAACPRNAIYKREEDGVVLVDQTRCRGYKECVQACPYKKTFYNIVTRVSEKCIACYPLLEKGEQPRCVQTCIGKIRLQGWISKPDHIDEDNPIDYIVHVKKAALPLYPQFGLEPNVYYIPPVHVPEKFLKQLFGPNVMNAINVYKNVHSDKKLLAALLLFGNSPEIIVKFKVEGEECIGYNSKGDEVVRVPFTEPFFQRPFFDEKNDVYRINTL